MNLSLVLEKALRALASPKYYGYLTLIRLGFHDNRSDEEFIRSMYKSAMGRDIDLENPKTFTEKLNWLKLYNRKPEYTTMVDKYAVKNFVADKIGSEYVIPLLGVWKSFEEINFDELPEQFVLKCNHDSGGLVICRDKSKLDIAAARKKINKSMRKNYYNLLREWPYKNVPPRIIAEKYMQDKNNFNLPVYKIFNFNGVPKIIQAIQNDKTWDESIDYFDVDWNRLQLRQNYPNSKIPLPRPEKLSEMLELAAKLSAGIPQVRTDFFQINGKVYFSEYTFFSDGGMIGFKPEEWDEILGSWVELPKKFS